MRESPAKSLQATPCAQLSSECLARNAHGCSRRAHDKQRHVHTAVFISANVRVLRVHEVRACVAHEHASTHLAEVGFIESTQHLQATAVSAIRGPRAVSAQLQTAWATECTCTGSVRVCASVCVCVCVCARARARARACVCLWSACA